MDGEAVIDGSARAGLARACCRLLPCSVASHCRANCAVQRGYRMPFSSELLVQLRRAPKGEIFNREMVADTSERCYAPEPMRADARPGESVEPIWRRSWRGRGRERGGFRPISSVVRGLEPYPARRVRGQHPIDIRANDFFRNGSEIHSDISVPDGGLTDEGRHPCGVVPRQNVLERIAIEGSIGDRGAHRDRRRNRPRVLNVGRGDLDEFAL